ncbi:MAG TPA: AAA family ATPase [Bryobacteraceae bacterium]|nr:AAA family ATPase [Bryobacteraceae bacterium]
MVVATKPAPPASITNVPPLLTRVVLKNYKSIAATSVDLRPLTFLVGPNGSGKSNFLDALRFTSDSLRTSLDSALRERGGIAEVRRRSGGHPSHFGVRLEFRLPAATGHYAFRIGARPRGGYEVQTEECIIGGDSGAGFWVTSGEVTNFKVGGTRNGFAAPAALKDRLYLVNVSGIPVFRPVYDALSRMGFYNLNPDRIRDFQAPDSGELLTRDGGNLTSVLRQLSTRDDARKKRIEEYLSSIVPDVRGVDVKDVPPKVTLEFRQGVAGSTDPWRFFAGNMSDGTLRALGILIALFQSEDSAAPNVPLVGIEEPEIALHPAAVGALLDALREASRSTQVIVTTHSPDLLDSADIESELLLAVHAEEGTTELAPVDEASRSAVRKGLYTAGDLLRLDQLRPDTELFGQRSAQAILFDGAGS